MHYSLDHLKSLLLSSSTTHKSIIHFNSRSLPKHYDDLVNFLTLADHAFSLICLSETWLSSDDDKLFALPGYQAEYNHRSTDRHGGSAIFISNDISYKRRQDIMFLTQKCESVWLEFDRFIFASTKNTIIGCIYRSPSASYEQFCCELECILHTFNHENKNIIILGDINIDITDMTDSSCSLYTNCLLGHGMESLLASPTRFAPLGSSTLIDHVLSNIISPQIAGVINFDITDHYPIFLLVECPNNTTPKKRSQQSFNKKRFVELVTETNWDTVLGCTSANNAFSLFSMKLKEIINTCTTITLTTHWYSAPRNPWITKGLLKCIKKKSNLRKKVKTQPFNIRLKQRLQKYSDVLSAILKRTKQEYYQNEILRNRNNTHKNWETIKEFLNLTDIKTNTTKVSVGTRTLSDHVDIANAFNSFFSRSDSSLPSNFRGPRRCPYSFYLRPTSPDEVCQVISSLKNTSPGLDSVHSFKIKLVASELSSVLSHIINLVFRTGVFPLELKQGKVIPIFKKGDKENLANYRPITILPFFSKVIEKLIVNRIMNYLLKFKLLAHQQFGFRPNYSTELALIEFTDRVKQFIDNGFFAGAVFLDFTKAFDTINHTILFTKLETLGICGPALDLLRSYITNRIQVVQFQEALSQPLTINLGVPQGSILGPLLFLIYINDLPSCLTNTSCILYADDTTIFTQEKCLTRLINKLNKDLQNIVSWCQSNLLQLNPTKTTFMVFHSHQKQCITSSSIFLGEHIIPASESVTFLGIILDSHLKFNLHTKYISKKISFGIRVLIKTRYFFQRHILLSLYYAFINSHLNYCISSWGNTYACHLSSIFHLQNQALRVISFSPYMVSASPLYSDLNVLPITSLLNLRLGLLIYRARNDNNQISCFSASLLVNSNNTRFSEQANMLLPKVNTNYGKQTAFFSAIKVWNSLPQTIKSARSQHSFHTSLKNHLLSSHST